MLCCHLRETLPSSQSFKSHFYAHNFITYTVEEMDEKLERSDLPKVTQ